MQLNAVLTFFLITFCLGYTILWLSKTKVADHPLIYALELFSVGLATFSFLGVVLGLFHVPLHLYVYLGLAVIGPVIALFTSKKGKEKSKVPKNWWYNETAICFLGLLIVLVLSFMLFHKGAFSYPYLENDDPWNHAQAATYVAREYTYSIDREVRVLNGGYAFYLEPYPPTYGVLMGVLRQTNDSIIWTLKFFNALLVALALATWYLFARAYLKSDRKALFSTAVLAVLPSFMSHFIWSQTIAIAIFPVGLYATLRSLDDKSWVIPAIIAVASMMVTQPVVSFLFGLVLILAALLLFVHELLTKKGPAMERFSQTARVVTIGAAGLALSFVYWGAQLAKWTLKGFLELRGGELPGSGAGWGSGYALQSYSFKEVFLPPHASRIDQAVGWGPILTIMLVLGLIAILVAWRRTLAPKSGWRHAHLILWFIILAYLVFAPTFGLPGYGSSRLWVELAMPLALLAAEGTFIIAASITRADLIRLAIAGVVLLGIILTSLPAKMEVQTAQWPPGAQWTVVLDPNTGGPVYVELPGYLQLLNKDVVPKNSRLFAFCSGDQRAIGFDMQADPWDLEHSKFRQRVVNASGEEILGFLKLHNYKYVTMDATCVRQFGENETTMLANRLTATQSFRPIITVQGFLLAEVI